MPLLDHPLIEFAASVPADVKFRGGEMKHLLKTSFRDVLPDALLQRPDKMGFPVPLREWFSGDLKTMVEDMFRSQSARSRPFINSGAVLPIRSGRSHAKSGAFKPWNLGTNASHDRAHEWRAKLN